MTAEQLLDIADSLLKSRGTVIVLDGWPEELCAAAVLGVLLRRARPVVAFRAVVEGWDRERIVRELN